MITINEWFQKFQNGPLKIVASFLVGIWLIFAIKSYFNLIEKHLTDVEQIADFLSITTESKDRVMTEILLETLLSQAGADSAALCEGNKQIISANQSQSGCETNEKYYENIIEKKIPGSSDIFLKAKFNILKSFYSLFVYIFFGFAFVLAGFYFIHISKMRINKDILKPLLGGLLSEEKFEIYEMNELRDKFKKTQVEMILYEKRAAEASIALQVSHDIRSPLSALNIAMSTLSLVPKDKKVLIGNAIKRINDIANNLLQQGKELSIDKVNRRSFPNESIINVIETLLAEKRIEYSKNSNIKIVFDLNKDFKISSSICHSKLERVISNLVNNSAESIIHKGIINVALRCYALGNTIYVSDNGKGIPADILSKIGEKGLSYGKNGNGLGFFHAKSIVESFGGKIKIQSQVNIGTIVTINFPNQMLIN